MSISDKSTKEFQELFNTKYGVNYTFEQAREAGDNLVGLVEMLYKLKLKEDARKERLKVEPNGFALLDGPYTCGVCGRQTTNEDNWYDEFGIKCKICQRAIDQKQIPGSVCLDHDSWYSTWELDSYFGIKYQTARKLVRLGKLNAKIVMDENEKPCCYIFLIEDNPNVLGPKPKPITQRNEDGSFSVEWKKMTLNI